jgi:phosphate binding protein
MSKFVRSFVFTVIALSFVLVACGAPAPTEKAEAPAASEAPATEAVAAAQAPVDDALAMYAPDAVSGDIATAGSSTVFPLSERMAELFQQEGFAGSVTVDSIGTGAGFERFCKSGETDISNASRKIKDSEVENCKAINRAPIAFRVGTDALTVVVSSQNDFVTDLTKEQLGKIFSGELKKWSDVDAAYPAEAIKVYSPGGESGTTDYFVEAVVAPLFPGADGKPDTKKGKEVLLSLEGAQYSEDDNVLVKGIEGDKYAIGFFGFAYFNENQGQLKAVAVEGVEPSEATVNDGTYPLARPLFVYSDTQIMKDKPQVAAFIYFYLQNVNDNIVDIGYFPAPEAELQAAMDAWKIAVGQ